ncbi:cupin domain-containing protein [Kitasatospora nipponensis]|uniref:Cupin domain-containing protein n=1 Tax=Kitasatospora nipponensis TaxID=258049 RepID=A0ABP4HKT4_9ACTN
MMDHQLFHLDALAAEQDAAGRRYLEFLRTDTMSGGVYTLAAGAEDPQLPHREDELYVVLAGAGVLRVGEAELPVRAGSVAFVAAQAVHRFHDITEDLRVLVLFAPAESDG